MKNQKHNLFKLIYAIGNLAELNTSDSNTDQFLIGASEVIADHINADACHVYLLNKKSNMLVLKACTHNHHKYIGNIHIKPGEGPIGVTFQNQIPVHGPEFGSLKDFKRNHSLPDFESFISLPIQKGTQKFGVLAIFHQSLNFFDECDLTALRTASSQLAGAIDYFNVLMDLESIRKKNEPVNYEKPSAPIKGESSSFGYAFGKVIQFKRSHGELITDQQVQEGSYSLDDFYKALQQTTDQLIGFQSRLAEQMIESASLIFSAHLMILKDAKFINRIVQKIMSGISPQDAIRSVANYYIDIFSSSSHTYIREKVSDIEDLSGRLLKNLFHWKLYEPGTFVNKIVVAKELYPSEILKLASEDVKGIILVRGGITSHVSILARSMKIPLIISDAPQLMDIPEGTSVLLDAEIGQIHINPPDSLISEYSSRIKHPDRLTHFPAAPETKTRDGVRIKLLANINLLSELNLAREMNADGIGLYRTEFPFLIRSTLPSENEQYMIYKRLVDEMKDRVITIRTLDVGGEKLLNPENSEFEANSQLGLRSIRFLLSHMDIFQCQIRAILKAGAEAKQLRIMFPMISSLDEFHEAKQVIINSIALLKQMNALHCSAPKIGIMAELPAVMEIIHELVAEADFISIGSNDFIQYTLAVDRSDKNVAHYYCPHHPSVLRGLAKITKAAIAGGKEVAICGEMAHQVEFIPFLLGIGIRNFSVSPQFLPNIQQTIQTLTVPEAETIASALLAEPTLKGTLNLINQFELSKSG